MAVAVFLNTEPTQLYSYHLGVQEKCKYSGLPLTSLSNQKLIPIDCSVYTLPKGAQQVASAESFVEHTYKARSLLFPMLILMTP